MVDKTKNDYLMEHPDEALRLDIKTDPDAVREQALLCGIGPGARVLDVGCGSGRASSVLHDIVGPQGEVVGVDYSEERLKYARQHFGKKPGISFRVADFTRPMADLGYFDYIWVRFVLEYFLREARDIVENLTRNLKSDGRLCLLDLDHNSLNHYPLPEEMEVILFAAFQRSCRQLNFDPYAGRKLYSYLYDHNYRDIRVGMVAHHLIYGELRPQDEYNWTRKFYVSASKNPDVFDSYPGKMDGFFEDFYRIFKDPRRFTYTPMIICSGIKPLEVM
jgi:ubiquinone/menaquinone biosynthesis C-methylase UbiE